MYCQRAERWYESREALDREMPGAAGIRRHLPESEVSRRRESFRRESLGEHATGSLDRSGNVRASSSARRLPVVSAEHRRSSVEHDGGGVPLQEARRAGSGRVTDNAMFERLGSVPSSGGSSGGGGTSTVPQQDTAGAWAQPGHSGGGTDDGASLQQAGDNAMFSTALSDESLP